MAIRVIDSCCYSIVVVDLLLAGGSEVNHNEGTGGTTALIEAVRNSHVAMAKHLIDHGADVNLANTAAETPVVFALAKNDAKIMLLLLGNGAATDVRVNGQRLEDVAAGLGFVGVSHLLKRWIWGGFVENFGALVTLICLFLPFVLWELRYRGLVGRTRASGPRARNRANEACAKETKQPGKGPHMKRKKANKGPKADRR
jgi:hypothetical protein